MKTDIDDRKRIKQGDILSDVEYIKSADVENDGKIRICKIRFPLVIVLSQDCDLEQNYNYRNQKKENEKQEEGNEKQKKSNDGNLLFTAIVAPLYNYEHFIKGQHLSNLGLNMRIWPEGKKKEKNGKKEELPTERRFLHQNETQRYHYIKFPDNVPIVVSVIDFKHYFAVTIEELEEHKATHSVYSVPALQREQITQRFANFLARIGLPESKRDGGDIQNQ